MVLGLEIQTWGQQHINALCIYWGPSSRVLPGCQALPTESTSVERCFHGLCAYNLTRKQKAEEALNDLPKVISLANEQRLCGVGGGGGGVGAGGGCRPT